MFLLNLSLSQFASFSISSLQHNLHVVKVHEPIIHKYHQTQHKVIPSVQEVHKVIPIHESVHQVHEHHEKVRYLITLSFRVYVVSKFRIFNTIILKFRYSNIEFWFVYTKIEFWIWLQPKVSKIESLPTLSKLNFNFVTPPKFQKLDFDLVTHLKLWMVPEVAKLIK